MICFKLRWTRTDSESFPSEQSRFDSGPPGSAAGGGTLAVLVVLVLPGLSASAVTPAGAGPAGA